MRSATSRRAGRLWVHVADAAALVAPDSPLDLEARARATSLLPARSRDADAAARRHAGAGPGADRGLAGAVVRHHSERRRQIADVNSFRAWCACSRLTYEEADARMAEEPFRTI